MEAAGQPVAQICQKLEISAATLARLFRPPQRAGRAIMGAKGASNGSQEPTPRLVFLPLLGYPLVRPQRARRGWAGVGRAVYQRVSVGWLEHSLRSRLRLVRPEGRRH